MINGIIHLPDDRIEIIRNSDDFVRLIHDKLGFDAGQMAQELADLTEKAAHLADSDFRAYEFALEDVGRTLRELRELTEELSAEIGRTRVDKANIRRIIDRMETLIDEEI